ncbi:hypothetical protein CCP4SC76_2160007 [Gammaproteobacteria bacterium]
MFKLAQLNLIITIVRFIMPADIFDRIKALVIMLVNADMSGEAKKQGVITMLKTTGGAVEKKLPEVETWLVNLAIEALVGWAKNKYPKTGELLIPL